MYFPRHGVVASRRACMFQRKREETGASLSNPLRIREIAWKGTVDQLVGALELRKNSGSHIDASHSRQPLVKGERLVRYEVNAMMHFQQVPFCLRQYIPLRRICKYFRKCNDVCNKTACSISFFKRSHPRHLPPASKLGPGVSRHVGPKPA